MRRDTGRVRARLQRGSTSLRTKRTSNRKLTCASPGAKCQAKRLETCRILRQIRARHSAQTNIRLPAKREPVSRDGRHRNRAQATFARRNSKSLTCQAPGRANVRVAIRLPDFAIVVHDRGRPIFNDGISAKGIPPCHSCHGPGGAGNEKFPRLAGQHADYLVKQLTVFQRTDERPEGSIMKTVAHDLTQENIIDVAAYLQALPYQKAP